MMKTMLSEYTVNDISKEKSEYKSVYPSVYVRARGDQTTRISSCSEPVSYITPHMQFMSV
jgi:hypothetical protein